MLTRAQQILLKRAQREAGLNDEDYRAALVTVAGCRSSKDPDFTDSQLDAALAYFEAIHWRAVDQGQIQHTESQRSIFRERGFWSARNKAGDNSRERFVQLRLKREISDSERALAALGHGPDYLAAIRAKVTHGSTDARSLHHYRIALERTLRAKQRKLQPAVYQSADDNSF
jgi:hypothetical protein